MIAALAADRFLSLPHPEVAGYEQQRATDRDRWLAGVRRLRIRATVGAGGRSAVPQVPGAPP